MAKEITTPRFLKEYKLWRACAKDDIRDALNYICFDNGYAYATNGHIIAKVGLDTLTALLNEDEKKMLNGFCIHADVYKALVQYTNIQVISNGEKVQIVCPVNKNTVTFELVAKQEVLTPNYESVFKAEGKSHPIEKIGLAKNYLNDLTAALGLDRIKMDFYSESAKIIVSPINEEYLDIKGLIMPIMTTGTMDF